MDTASISCQKSFRITISVTEDHVKEEAERDTDEEEDYDPVPCKISENKIMFVYQSDEMQRLYRRYAPTLVLLDATYRTTKYLLPLYFLVV